MTSKKVAIKDTAILATGSISAQIITLLLMPVVTRLYAPDQFGLLGTILALSIPIVAISSLRYFDAIMLPDEEGEALKIFQLAMLLNVFCSLLLFILIYLFSDNLAIFLGIQESSKLLYMVPLFVFIVGGRRVLDAWLQRKKTYIAIASASVVTSIIDRIVTISVGFLGYVTVWGLIAGRFTGLVSGTLVMIIRAIQTGAITDRSSCSYTKRYVAKKYFSFAKYSWSAWIMQLTMEMPVLVIGAYFNPVIVGLYILSRRVLMEPAILIGEALSKTFYVKAAELHKQSEDLSELCSSLVLILFKLSVPPMCVFAVAAPDLFHVVFGEKWRDAGIYAVYLTPMYLMGFYMQPLTRLFNVLDKQRDMALFSLQRFAALVIALFIGIQMSNPIYLFICMSIATMFLGLNRMRWIFSQIGVKNKVLVMRFVIYVAAGVIMASVIYTIDKYYILDELDMTILFSFVCGAYYLYVFRDYKALISKNRQ